MVDITIILDKDQIQLVQSLETAVVAADTRADKLADLVQFKLHQQV